MKLQIFDKRHWRTVWSFTQIGVVVTFSFTLFAVLLTIWVYLERLIGYPSIAITCAIGLASMITLNEVMHR